MTTAFLVLLLIVAIPAVLCFINWLFGQGLFAWFFYGSDLAGAALEGLAAIFMAIVTINSDS